MTELKPLIKCLGGKRRLTNKLRSLMPKEYRWYIEPFAGGLALLLAERPAKFKINDRNKEIAFVYRSLRDQRRLLLEKCKKHQENYSKDYYLELRAAHYLPENYNRGHNDREYETDVAARFLFLNKACYGGVTRYNSQGQFNTPFGGYPKDAFKVINAEQAELVGKYLSSSEEYSFFGASDFQEFCKWPSKNSLYYFDPPYLKKSKTSNFSAYTKEGFGYKDHIRLRDLAFKLWDKNRCYVMISGSDCPETWELYQGHGFRIEKVNAARSINSNSGKRGKIGELIITSNNYTYRGKNNEAS